MKEFILILVLLVAQVVSADELQVPFSCWPLELQKEFAKEGIKVDLNGVQRTKDSWGYILNQGNKYTIFTYDPMNNDDFIIIQKIILDVETKNNG